MTPETVREVEAILPPSWKWRPEWLEEGEAARLLLAKELDDDSIGLIRRDAVEVLARCRPPNADDGRETGLVVGYVQSGKTLSFTTVAALAGDNGFPLVIVLSGTKHALTQQTVKRLRRDLAVEEPASRWNLIEGGTSNPQLAQQLRQFLGLWDQADPFFPAKVTLLVLLKNKQRLMSLADTLQQVNLAGRPCLIIDDEADEHGLNTRVQRGELSPTYQAILHLRNAVPNHTYLQYTATPQANVLISVLDALSPGFGWVLTPGDHYTGGQAFFGGSQDLISTIPDEDLAVASAQHLVDDPPESLLEAMRLFFVGAAAQACNRREGRQFENLRSLLVHPSMQKLDHFRFRTWIERVRQRWIALLGPEGDEADRSEEMEHFRKSWEDLNQTIQERPGNEHLPPFDEIEPRLLGALRITPPTWEVNSRDAAAKWDHTNWSLAPSHILVGGENLGRGFTVEGLTVTYMPRGSGQGQVDTIEQRGRFFGYKRSYLGFCRVFLAPEVRDIYTEYLRHEEFLIGKLHELAEQPDASMKEWRRAMILASSVQPTRPNVLPAGLYKQLKVSAWTKYEFPLSLDLEADLVANRTLVDKFVSELEFTSDGRAEGRTVDQVHGSAQVPLRNLLDELLVPLAYPPADSFKFSGLELVLGYHLSRVPDATATVLRMSHLSDPHEGGGRRDRTAKAKNNFRVNPSQGRSKGYPGDESVRGNDVTVQIHDVDIRSEGGELIRGNMPLLAVWVPEPVRQGVFMED